MAVIPGGYGISFEDHLRLARASINPAARGLVLSHFKGETNMNGLDIIVQGNIVGNAERARRELRAEVHLALENKLFGLSLSARKRIVEAAVNALDKEIGEV